MNKLIRYLIYKNYKWQVFVKTRSPIKAAIFGVVFPLGMIMLAALIFCTLKIGLEVNYYILLPVLTVVFIYEYLLYRRVVDVGINSIIKEFEDRDEPREKLTTFLTLLYSLLAMSSPIVVALLMLRIFN